MNQNAIKEILTKHKIVAVVGLSKDTGKDSRRVSSYLKQHDFRVMSVNPFADKVLGEQSYRSLLDVPPEFQKTMEIVDIFRPSKDVPPRMEQSVKLEAA